MSEREVRSPSDVDRGQHLAVLHSAWATPLDVEVLLRVYAKCIDGHEDADRRRIEKFMSLDAGT